MSKKQDVFFPRVPGPCKADEKTVPGFSVKAGGIRRDEHPTSFKTIYLEFDLNSGDAADSDIRKAIHMSGEKYCPVRDMVGNNVEIVTDYRITL